MGTGRVLCHHLPAEVRITIKISLSIPLFTLSFQSELLVKAGLSRPAASVSFQPYNDSQLCTTGGGELSVWRIIRLSDRHDISAAPATLPEGFEPTSHAWFPQGLYVGGGCGELLAIDAETLTPLLFHERIPDEPMQEEDSAGLSPPHDGSLQLLRATPSGSAVSAICVSRDHVVVVGSEPIVRWFTHATRGFAPGADLQPQKQPFELCAEHGFGGASSPAAMDLGGDQFGVLVFGSTDGSISVAELEPSTGEVRAMAVPILEAHSGTISALCPHPSREGAVLSCGHDGSLRLWDLHGGGGACVARRTFSSAQTSLASCPSREMVAVGSENGVLR